MPTDQLTQVPLHALCIACNYSLRGLSSSRCPECGREFDPADPRTMNLRKPVGRFGRRLLRPRIWPMAMCLLGVSGWHAWVARFPGEISPRDARHALWAWAAVGALWVLVMLARLGLIALRRPPRELRQRVWRRWLPLAAAMAGAFWLVRGDRPFRAALWVSKPSMARCEAELLSNAPRYTYTDRWVGLFPADHVYTTGTAVGFHVVDRRQGDWWLCTSAWTKTARQASALATKQPARGLMEDRVHGRWRLERLDLPLDEVQAVRRHELMRWIAMDDKHSADSAAVLVESLGSSDKEWRLWEAQTGPGYAHGLTLRWDMCGLRRLGPAAVSYLRPALKSPDVQRRRNSTSALRLLRQDAAEATADLASALGDGDWQVREGAALALGAIGPAARSAAPALYRALNDPDEDMRRWVGAEIPRVKPEPSVVIAGVRGTIDFRAAERKAGRSAVIGCQEAYGEIDPAKQLVESLGDCGPPAVPLLLDILRAPEELAYGKIGERFGYFEPAVRPVAFAALAKTGPRSRETDTALAELLKREDVWEDAPNEARALAVELGRHDPQWAAWLAGRLPVAPRDKDGYDPRPDYAIALAELAPDDKGALDYLFDSGARGWEESRSRFGSPATDLPSALGAAAKNSPAIIAALTRQLDRPGHEVPAASALRAAGRESVALPVLLRLATRGRPDVVWELAEMKSHAAEIVPVLAPLLASGDAPRRVEVAQVLTRLGSDEGIPVLAGYLSSAEPGTRLAAADSLCEAGPLARSALPKLLPVLGDRELTSLLLSADPGTFNTRYAVARLLASALTALAHIGPEARETATPVILELLGRLEGSESVHAQCASTLLAVGASGDDVVRAMTALLRHPDPKARLAAVKLLGAIGPPARSALPVLDEVYLSELSDGVREAIDEARPRIEPTRNSR